MLKFQIIPVTPLQQNCTIFWDAESKRGAAVDPGGDIDVIQNFTREQGITLEKLLVTHGHLDHCGQTAKLARTLDVPIIGPHRADKFWIDQIPATAAQYGFADAEAFEPHQWLDHGAQVEAAGVMLNVLHCPGHTPGHVVFYEPSHKVAMVGDVLFKGSIGRTDFPKGNLQDLLDSITQNLWPLGDDVTFIPGHGPHSTFGAERQSNPFVSDTALAD